MKKIAIPGLHIERLIAKGGMAHVYAAEQKSLGRKVAVKVLDSHASDPEFAERFFYEARLIATLHHHHIITIHDFGTLDDGKVYLSMEYFPGGDLETRLRKNILEEKDILRILKELARGLNFIHGKGIIHRDIKPANILFREDGSLVLTDFGIARDQKGDAVAMTQVGMTVGSPAYSSPEQAQGKTLDHRSDIYSVGVVLYEIFTGINPFRGSTPLDTAIHHLQMPIPVLPPVFSRFQPLMEKMLAKNPDDRLSSMLDVLAWVDELTANSKDGASPTITASTPVVTPPVAPGADWVPAGYASAQDLTKVTAAEGPTYRAQDIVSALALWQRTTVPGTLLTLDAVLDALVKVAPDEGDEPKQLCAGDTASIDSVIELFAKLAHPPLVPTGVKIALCALQPIYVVTALQDGALFARAEHPARCLLENFLHAALSEEPGATKRRETVRRLALQLREGYNSQVVIFYQIQGELNASINAIRDHEAQQAKLAAQRSIAGQHLQQVKTYVHERIKSRVADEQLPAPVAMLLLYPWYDYLTSVMMRYGESSEPWQQGFQLIDHLLWSIKPKTTAHEINRLKNLRAILQQQMRSGFETIGYDHARGETLLRKIAALQDAALAADLSGTPLPPSS